MMMTTVTKTCQNNNAEDDNKKAAQQKNENKVPAHLSLWPKIMKMTRKKGDLVMRKRYLLISPSDRCQLLLDPRKLPLQLRHPFAWPDHHHHHHGEDGDDEEENDDDLLSIIARFSTSWMEILFFLLITPLRISSTFTFKVWSSWSWDDGDDDPLKIHPSSISIRMLRAMKTIWNLWGWWWRRDL